MPLWIFLLQFITFAIFYHLCSHFVTLFPTSTIKHSQGLNIMNVFILTFIWPRLLCFDVKLFSPMTNTRSTNNWPYERIGNVRSGRLRFKCTVSVYCLRRFHAVTFFFFTQSVMSFPASALAFIQTNLSTYYDKIIAMLLLEFKTSLPVCHV